MSTPFSDTSSTERPTVNTSIGGLLADVTRDISTLMRQEVALAKAEIKEEAVKSGKAAGMLGGAGYAAHITVLFLSFALWWGLASAIDHIGWAAFIVAVLWGIAAAVLAVVGKGKLKQVHAPDRTIATVKEIPDALKPSTS